MSTYIWGSYKNTNEKKKQKNTDKFQASTSLDVRLKTRI